MLRPRRYGWRRGLVWFVLSLNAVLLAIELAYVVSYPERSAFALRLWCVWGLPLTSGAACYYYWLAVPPRHRAGSAKLFYFLSVGQFTAWALYFALCTRLM